MPPTSGHIPLIEAYFCCIMFEVWASVVCTMFTLNFHHRTPERHNAMRPLTKKIMLEWLPSLVFMKRPLPFSLEKPNGVAYNCNIDKKKFKTSYTSPTSSDFFFDLLQVCQIRTAGNLAGSKMFSQDSWAHNYMAVQKRLSSHSMGIYDCSELCQVPENGRRSSCVDIMRYKNALHPMVHVLGDALDDRQFTSIMKELCVISSHVRKEELMHDQQADWMFAAMVLDRLWMGFANITQTCVVESKVSNIKLIPIVNADETKYYVFSDNICPEGFDPNVIVSFGIGGNVKAELALKANHLTIHILKEGVVLLEELEILAFWSNRSILGTIIRIARGGAIIG
ncbi:unnamed protein product [Cylicocyclus nassatus]|uniref:Neurotransmitter-gated ion-channel transmembrane domain-containing protein n=1 Tax=Cylicocyclus nassatus TaxID=53992 RepID=A0AA36GL92_CYLNA|nr:unnamed protein product [Cylicocyclus nassatus]